MEPKKNPGADLERWRGFFFLAGLSLALLAAILVLQLKQEVSVSEPPVSDPFPIADADPIPITKMKIEKPAGKPVKERTAESVVDPVEDTELQIPDEWTRESGTPEEELEPIAREETPEDPEPVSMILVQHVAVPPSCNSFIGKEERIHCLNEWIQEYISNNLRYPEMARKLNLTDRVSVGFVISTEGKIEQVYTIGDYEILNQEAKRVLLSMPDWVPAQQFNKKVRMSMSVPVNFRLQ